MQLSKSDEENSSSSLYAEEIRRTMWACLLVETMLGGGKYSPLSIQLGRYDIPLPSSDDSFAFGIFEQHDSISLELLDFDKSNPLPIQMPTKHGEPSFSLIIQGFNIWSVVSNRVSSRGQKDIPAWETDPFWGRGLEALEHWRAAQGSRMVYSPGNNNLQAYITRNQAERFAFLNLIYYITALFIHRQLTRLLPHQNGPSETTHPGWLHSNSSSRKLLENANNIIHLMKHLHYGIDLRAPFTCFCVFNAMATVAHAHKWFHTTPGTQDASELLEWGVEWLREAGNHWEIAQGWYNTLTEIIATYDCLDMGSPHLSDTQRHKLSHIHDRLARLDESSAPIAQILSPQDSQPEQLDIGTRDPQQEDCGQYPAVWNLETGQESQLLDLDPHNPSLTALQNGPFQPPEGLAFDHDFLTAVLSDPSGNLIPMH